MDGIKYPFIGNQPNDGQGAQLRTAFSDTNNNIQILVEAATAEVLARIAADELKAPLSGAELTDPTTNTPAAGDSSTKVATTAFAQGAVSSVAKWGVVPGASDLATKLQAAIDAAAVIARADTANNDTVTYRLYVPAGVYTLTAPVVLKNGVQIVGDGSGATCFVIDHSGDGFVTTSGQYSNVWLRGMQIKSAGTARDGISVVGFIRNCGFSDVLLKGFRNSFYFQDTWTPVLDRCNSYSVTQSHVYCDTGCGEIVISGGRYDVAADHGIYMNAPVGHLTMRGAAVQFGQKSAVKVAEAQAVYIEGCFFEGDCIGSVADYYLDLTGNNGPLSSCFVHFNAVNDQADSNRSGLGVGFADKFEMLSHIPKWSRNGVQSVFRTGPDIVSSFGWIDTSADITPFITSVTETGNHHATIRQVARPDMFLGPKLDWGGTPNPKFYSALLAGSDPAKGMVALAQHGNSGAVQGTGDSNILKINPLGGRILFGSQGGYVEDGTNEFTGRHRPQATLGSSNSTPAATHEYVGVDCTAGNRLVTMTNVVAAAGRRLIVGKRDGTTNTITITPASGTINGSATLVLSAAYEHVTLISDGTNWFVESRS